MKIVFLFYSMIIKLLLLKLIIGVVYLNVDKPKWPAVTPTHLRND